MKTPEEADNGRSLHLYWWKRKPNFGDALGPFLVHSLSGLSVTWSDSPDSSVLATVGSIVGHAKSGWSIFGSGCISREEHVPENVEVLAVRGPETRKKFEQAGHAAPAVYGDPGLLMPLARPLQDVAPKYDWGIIPHYTDLGHPISRWLRLRQIASNILGPMSKRKACLIDPRLPIEDYMRRFECCRAIAAGSLHGLVMAEAYGKPNVWIRFAGYNNVLGGEFKYHDFAEGIGKPGLKPVVLGMRLDYEALTYALRAWHPMNWDPTPLMNAFPHRTSMWEKNTQKAATYFNSLG